MTPGGSQGAGGEEPSEMFRTPSEAPSPVGGARDPAQSRGPTLALGHVPVATNRPYGLEQQLGLLPQGPSVLRTLCHPLWLCSGMKKQFSIDPRGPSLPRKSALIRESLYAFPSNYGEVGTRARVSDVLTTLSFF